jgi:hypothetical protein
MVYSIYIFNISLKVSRKIETFICFMSGLNKDSVIICKLLWMSHSAIRNRFSFLQVSEDSNFWWNKKPNSMHTLQFLSNSAPVNHWRATVKQPYTLCTSPFLILSPMLLLLLYLTCVTIHSFSHVRSYVKMLLCITHCNKCLCIMLMQKVVMYETQ